MAVLEESCSGAGSGGGDDCSDRQRCSCLPFCFWGTSNKPAKRRRRRRRLRLSWLAWPWSFFRKGDGRNKGKTKRRGRRLLLLLTASLQPKKALASVVSGDGALLPAKVSSFGDAKKKSTRKPRPTADADVPSASRHPQASTPAATGSTRWTTSTATAHARSRPETTNQPVSPGGRPGAGRIWRAPSRRHTYHQTESTERPPGGLWTAATTLGVIVLFGRVTAVVFLCSCLYGARFVRVRLGGRAKAKDKSSGVAGGGSISSSRRFGDPVGVGVGVAADKVVVAEQECKKKVSGPGLLDRAGKTPSSHFGR